MLQQELVDEYFDYLLINRHYSQETKKSYSEDIDNFVSALEENGGFNGFTDINKYDVDTYLTFMDEKKYSDDTIARRISSLRSFYNFLIRNNYVKKNPFELVQLRRKGRKLPRFFMKKRWISFLMQ